MSIFKAFKKKKEIVSPSQATEGVSVSRPTPTKPMLFSGTLKRPWFSEKANVLNEKRQYVFLVERPTNKQEIKKEVERRFGVRVQSVNTIMVAGKTKRIGMQRGRRLRFKKAIVTLKEGEKMEII